MSMTLIDLAEDHNSWETSRYYLAVVAGNCLVAQCKLSVHIRFRVAGNSGMEEKDPYQTISIRIYPYISYLGRS